MKWVDGIKTYGSEGEAFRRVASLQHNEGIWTGVLRWGNRWCLNHDPDNAQARGPAVQVKGDEGKPTETAPLEEYDEAYREMMADLAYERDMRSKGAAFAAIDDVADNYDSMPDHRHRGYAA